MQLRDRFHPQLCLPSIKVTDSLVEMQHFLISGADSMLLLSYLEDSPSLLSPSLYRRTRRSRYVCKPIISHAGLSIVLTAIGLFRSIQEVDVWGDDKIASVQIVRYLLSC